MLQLWGQMVNVQDHGGFRMVENALYGLVINLAQCLKNKRGISPNFVIVVLEAKDELIRFSRSWGQSQGHSKVRCKKNWEPISPKWLEVSQSRSTSLQGQIFE